MESAEEIDEPPVEQSPERGVLGPAEEDLVLEGDGIVDVPLLRRDVEVPHDDELLVGRVPRLQVPRQRVVPAQLVRVLLGADLAAVGDVDIDDGHVPRRPLIIRACGSSSISGNPPTRPRAGRRREPATPLYVFCPWTQRDSRRRRPHGKSSSVNLSSWSARRSALAPGQPGGDRVGAHPDRVDFQVARIQGSDIAFLSAPGRASA